MYVGTPGMPLVISCQPIMDEYFGGVSCSSSGGIGDITYTCTYDDDPPEPCEPMRQCTWTDWCDVFCCKGTPSLLFLDLFQFSSTSHRLVIVATDAVGSTSTFIYTFIGQSPPGMAPLSASEWTSIWLFNCIEHRSPSCGDSNLHCDWWRRQWRKCVCQ